MNTMSNEGHPRINKGVEVAGVTLKSAVNAKRVRVLMRRKNGLFTDCPERDGIAGIESLFYCLSLDGDQLASSFGWTQEQWDEAVEQFALGLPDGGLEEFSALFAGEQSAINAAAVEPEDTEGKTEGQTTGQGPAGSQASSPREWPPGSRIGKPHLFPSSTSSSTSTLGGASEGSDTAGKTAAENQTASCAI